MPNLRVYTHAYERPCLTVKDPGVHVGGLYGNTKITSMHFYPQRWNVAAQVVEELKMVIYATSPMEERRKK